MLILPGYLLSAKMGRVDCQRISAEAVTLRESLQLVAAGILVGPKLRNSYEFTYVVMLQQEHRKNETRLLTTQLAPANRRP